MILNGSLTPGVPSRMYPESTVQLVVQLFLGMFYIPPPTQKSCFPSSVEYEEGFFIVTFPVVFTFASIILQEVTV